MDNRHYIAGGVYAKEVHLSSGEFIEQHVHKHGHLSLLARGQVAVHVNGERTVYTAPAAVNVKAGVSHKIVSLASDTLWYCVHAIPADLSDPGVIESLLVDATGTR